MVGACLFSQWGKLGTWLIGGPPGKRGDGGVFLYGVGGASGVVWLFSGGGGGDFLYGVGGAGGVVCFFWGGRGKYRRDGGDL